MLPRDSSGHFVGRAGELALLESTLATVVAGEPRAVVIGGEAGVGKSRLVEEFTTGPAAQAGAMVLTGSAIECAGAPLAYAAVSEALRALVRTLADESRAHLEGAYAELGRLVPELAAGPPPCAADKVETVRGRVYETVLSVLHEVARTQPVVLVIEDLHWADRSTRDVVNFLVQNLAAGVMLVATYRTDELPRGDPLRQFVAELSRGRRVQIVQLPPLTQPELLSQLTALNAGRPPAAVVDMVWARSEGNPFFAEELFAAAMRDDGRRLPPTLHDLLLGRAHTLSPMAQHVVRVAAVGGRRVSHRLLAGVAGTAAVPEAELVPALREAVTNQVLVADADADTYSFRHALLHEVAYAELLPGERSEIHAAYARTLTERPELASSVGAWAELARHWSAAYELPSALAASVDAAAAAEAAGGFAEAHEHLERAIELWDQVADADRPPSLDRLGLVERAAEDGHLAGDHHRAAALAQSALNALDPAGDPVRRGLLHERLGCYLAAAGHSEDALAAYAEAVGLVTEETSPERARVLAAEARALMLSARYRESRQRATEAVSIARRAGARLEEGQALGTLGFDLALLGEPEVGVSYLREALALAEEVGDLHGVALAYRHLAVVLSGPLSRLDEALTVARDGLQRVQQLRLDRHYGVSLQALAADTLFRLGRWEEADVLLAAALDHDPVGAAAIDLYLARAKLSVGRGRFEAAEEDLRTITELSTLVLDPQFNVPRSTLHAGLALWQGRLDDAREAVAQGLAELADTDEVWLLGPVLWHGVRTEAEAAAQARATRRPDGADDAATAGVAVLARARLLGLAAAGAGAGALADLLGAYMTMCEGEASRIDGAEDPEPWAAAAEAWDRLGQPYPAAYCRWRRADALLARGDRSSEPEALVRRAHGVAMALGARPLQSSIEDLARRARIDLTEPAADSAADSAADGPASRATAAGLTRREQQVLALLATGRTNRELAEALFISEKTASVHVSNILTKLGVRSRVEAAGVAQRWGLGAANVSG